MLGKGGGDMQVGEYMKNTQPYRLEDWKDLPLFQKESKYTTYIMLISIMY